MSRSWFYSQSDLRAEIERLGGDMRPAPSVSTSSVIPPRQRASDASLRRLEAVNAEIRRLRQENQQLREQLAWAHGEVRAVNTHRPIGQGDTSKGTRSATIGPCS